VRTLALAANCQPAQGLGGSLPFHPPAGGRYGHDQLTGFLPWLAKTKEQVLDLSTGNFTHLDNVLAVKAGKISLTLEPDQLVFVSAKTTSTTVARWLKV
jgi:hypothetical protein